MTSKTSKTRSVWEDDQSREPIPVWLDCDTGHDDAFAILVSALTPRLQLLGISTVYGNAPLDQTTSNTLSILTSISRTDVPVYPGCIGPICRPPCFAPSIHGSTGLDGTTCLPAPTTSSISRPSAFQAAYEHLMTTAPDTAYVVATGSLTNMAILFLTYPSLARHIKGLHIMGGAIGSSFTNAVLSKEPGRFGNWTPLAEFNIYCDPEAACSIFTNPDLTPKTFLAPLDLTHQFLATPSVLESLTYGFDVTSSHGQPSGVRRLFREILTFFSGTYAEVFGLAEGPPLHDVLPVLAVFAPEIFDDRGGERWQVKVIRDGEHGTEGIVREGGSRCGQTVVEKVVGNEGGVRIPRGMDVDAGWRIIDLCLGEAERRAARSSWNCHETLY